MELLVHFKRLTRPVIVVADGLVSDAATREGFDVITIGTKIGETLCPVHYSAPLAVLASHLADLTGAEYGRGCRGPWEGAAGGAAVRNSAILGD